MLTWQRNTRIRHHTSICINSSITPHVIFRTMDRAGNWTCYSINASGHWNANIRHWTSSRIRSSWTHYVFWGTYSWAETRASTSCTKNYDTLIIIISLCLMCHCIYLEKRGSILGKNFYRPPNLTGHTFADPWGMIAANLKATCATHIRTPETLER